MNNDNQDGLYQTNEDASTETKVHSKSHSTSKSRSKEDSSEVLNFDNPDYSFIPKGYHEWRQRGPYCVCTSCELEHAVFIGMDKVLIGIEDGQPIVKKKV